MFGAVDSSNTISSPFFLMMFGLTCDISDRVECRVVECRV